jgi:radical SAM protein with 4Fe4S-binding SPASM domain
MRETLFGNPWSIQVETVEGCNRLCEYCGLNGIRNTPGGLKLMTLETAEILAKQCADFIPTKRYEFAMHGENLLNPDFIKIVKIFRKNLPNAQMQLTTNGICIIQNMQQKVEELFDAGLNFIVLDTYYPERDLLHEKVKELAEITIFDFYKDIMPFSIWSNNGDRIKKTIVVVDDISVNTGKTRNRVLYNHAGNSKTVPVLTTPLKQKCTVPFREISVTWNGSVNLCCMDYSSEFTCGNITEMTLKDIWYSENFMAARRILYNKDRRFTPCSRCNHVGMRIGLLPKFSLPTESDYEVVRAAVMNNKWRNSNSKLKEEILF